MHIARVLARSDQAAAEALLEGASSLAKELDGSAASLLLENAVYLAAAVFAETRIPALQGRRRSDPFWGRGSWVNQRHGATRARRRRYPISR